MSVKLDLSNDIYSLRSSTYLQSVTYVRKSTTSKLGGKQEQFFDFDDDNNNNNNNSSSRNSKILFLEKGYISKKDALKEDNDSSSFKSFDSFDFDKQGQEQINVFIEQRGGNSINFQTMNQNQRIKQDFEDNKFHSNQRGRKKSSDFNKRDSQLMFQSNVSPYDRKLFSEEKQVNKLEISSVLLNQDSNSKSVHLQFPQKNLPNFLIGVSQNNCKETREIRKLNPIQLPKDDDTHKLFSMNQPGKQNKRYQPFSRINQIREVSNQILNQKMEKNIKRCTMNLILIVSKELQYNQLTVYYLNFTLFFSIILRFYIYFYIIYVCIDDGKYMAPMIPLIAGSRLIYILAIINLIFFPENHNRSFRQVSKLFFNSLEPWSNYDLINMEIYNQEIQLQHEKEVRRRQIIFSIIPPQISFFPMPNQGQRKRDVYLLANLILQGIESIFLWPIFGYFLYSYTFIDQQVIPVPILGKFDLNKITLIVLGVTFFVTYLISIYYTIKGNRILKKNGNFQGNYYFSNSLNRK